MGGIFGPLFDDQLALSRLTSRSCLQCDERWAGMETRFQSSPHRFGRLEKPGESALAFFLVIRRLLPPIWPTSHQAQSDHHQKCISLRGCSFVVCNSLARASRFRVQEVGFCACRPPSFRRSLIVHLWAYISFPSAAYISSPSYYIPLWNRGHNISSVPLLSLLCYLMGKPGKPLPHPPAEA